MLSLSDFFLGLQHSPDGLLQHSHIYGFGSMGIHAGFQRVTTSSAKALAVMAIMGILRARG